MSGPLPLEQVNLIVDDLALSAAFYRVLGWKLTPMGDAAARAALPNGITVAFHTPGFVPLWDTAYRGDPPGRTVIDVDVPTRDGVDELFRALVDVGGRPRQEPMDAIWGARYAIIEDPDGNRIGLKSSPSP